MEYLYKITVFTPTYNRAHTLSRLYDSLLRQADADFEWLIVDDGSTDDTESIIRKCIEDNRFPIRYYKQENGGKHRAINKGLDKADGELFFIVDSDDKLPPASINKIILKYNSVQGKVPNLGGIIGRKAYFDNTCIGSVQFYADKISSIFDLRYKMKITGDMSEIFLTDIIKKFPFPEIKSEKFCPESLIWNRIGKNYDFLITSDIFYQAEYQVDGLTANIFLLRKNSPLSSTLFYSELSRMPIPILQKLKAAINYWRFAHFAALPFRDKWRSVNPFLSLVALPLSFIFRIKDPK